MTARRPAAFFLLGAVLAGAMIVLLRPLGPLARLGGLLLILVPALLLVQARWATLGPSLRAACTGALILLALFQCVRTTRQIGRSAADPPEWDFNSFWIAGRVAVTGRDFYQPSSFDELVAPLDPSPEFRAEIVRVGFWYPPPTMLLLLPIGGLDVPEAARVWYAINGAGLAAAIAVLAWVFFRSMAWTGLAMAAALVTLFPGTDSTIRYAQSNALALLWLLLCWKDRDRMRGGVWLTLAIVTKPIAACVVAYALLRKQWRLLGGTFVGCAAAIAATAGFFGWGTISHYLTATPLARLPRYVYTQSVNQSLPATILRRVGTNEAARNPLLDPWVIGACLLVILVSLWRARARGSDDRLVFAIVLSAGLLVYPATLVHYSLLALLPILLLWAGRGRDAAGPIFVALLAGVVYALASSDVKAVIPVYLALWLGTIAISFRPAPVRETAPPGG